MKTTEDFDRGCRVRVNFPGHHMHGMIGTVTGRDFYTVDVHFETITPEMMRYEDTRTGNGAFRLEQLEKT